MKSIDLDRLHDYLHGIGGCDASDDWSKGWDEAVNTVINQIEEWRKEPVMIVKFQKAILGGNKAVSYTHLDVYKRQVCRFFRAILYRTIYGVGRRLRQHYDNQQKR